MRDPYSSLQWEGPKWHTEHRKKGEAQMENGAYRDNEGPNDVLTAENAVVLLIDHQAGLMTWVRDLSPEESRPT